MSVIEANFDEIYQQYNRLVQAYCADFVTADMSLDDLMQYTWAVIWRRRASYDGPYDKDRLAPYLTVVTKNACRNFYRDNISKEPELVNDSSLGYEEADGAYTSWLENQPDDQVLGPEEAYARDQHYVLSEASLSEQENAVFNLVYWHGYSYQGTADLLDIAVGTVKPIVHRIKAKFEPAFRHYGQKVYTYQEPSSVWKDWSYKPDGPANQQMGPNPVTDRPDLVEELNAS